MSRQDFFDEYSDMAQRVYGATGVFPSVALAQLAHESAFGSSAIARENKNLAGIKYVGQSAAVGESRNHAVYESERDFFDDYIRVLNLGYMAPVREGETPEQQINNIPHGSGSPVYATDPLYSQKVMNIWSNYDLEKYDSSEVQDRYEVPGGQVEINDDTATVTAEKSAWLPLVMIAGVLLLLGAVDA